MRASAVAFHLQSGSIFFLSTSKYSWGSCVCQALPATVELFLLDGCLSQVRLFFESQAVRAKHQ